MDKLRLKFTELEMEYFCQQKKLVEHSIKTTQQDLASMQQLLQKINDNITRLNETPPFIDRD